MTQQQSHLTAATKSNAGRSFLHGSDPIFDQELNQWNA
jgi:hypothetical protein